jgi:hypothetical protein
MMGVVHVGIQFPLYEACKKYFSGIYNFFSSSSKKRKHKNCKIRAKLPQRTISD